MLDEEFCVFLESRINQILSNSDNDLIKKFWCDGVLLPSNENMYSKKYVNDKRVVLLTAFIGYDGQDKFVLHLNFGPKSLSRYARGLRIEEFLPSDEVNHNFIITPEKKEIIIILP